MKKIIFALMLLVGITASAQQKSKNAKYDIEVSGNTSAATIPLALSKMVERGEIPSGALVLLLGFGSGLAYAGQVVLAP